MARPAPRGLAGIAASVIAALATSGCLPPTPASAPPQPPTATAGTGTSAPVPTAPQGLVVDVDGDGMTVSWFAVDAATEGYALSVDGNWRSVTGTKVHLEEYLPGLPYRVAVAGVAGGRRGPSSETAVDPEQGRKPPVVMTPQAPLAPSPPPVPVPSLWPDAAADPSPGAQSGDAGSPADANGLRARIDGCGFDADSRVNLTVLVVLGHDEARQPAVLLDDAGRTYLPVTGVGTNSTDSVVAFAPVAGGPLPRLTVIDTALYLSGPVGGERNYTQLDMPRGLKWGTDLCPRPVTVPHW